MPKRLPASCNSGRHKCWCSARRRRWRQRHTQHTATSTLAQGRAGEMRLALASSTTAQVRATELKVFNRPQHTTHKKTVCRLTVHVCTAALLYFDHGDKFLVRVLYSGRAWTTDSLHCWTATDEAVSELSVGTLNKANSCQDRFSALLVLPLTGHTAGGPLTRPRRSSGGASAGTDGLLTWAISGSRAQSDSPDFDPGHAPAPAGPSADQLQVCATAFPRREARIADVGSALTSSS